MAHFEIAGPTNVTAGIARDVARARSGVLNPEIVLTNLHSSFTGVSATIANLAEHHVLNYDAVVLGSPLPSPVPRIGWWPALRFLWRRPLGRRVRIWHARRNQEMLAGLLLKHVLRCPLKLVFTSVALRRHSRLPRMLMSGMDAIIATTAEAGDLAPRCDAIVPHGVDTQVFVPPADKRIAWQASGLPGRYGIGVFGRVRPEKGTDLFVDAMCRLLPRFPEFTAVIAGRWKDEHRAFQRALAERIDSAGLKERIVWLGEVPASERQVWFQRISLCVAPARYEGFGLTPIEAMASGAAAVATRTGVFPQLIEDGVNGYVVDREDAAALTGRIEQCLADPQELLEMGRRGRRHVAEHYDIRREAEGIEQVYRRIFQGEL